MKNIIQNNKKELPMLNKVKTAAIMVAGLFMFANKIDAQAIVRGYYGNNYAPHRSGHFQCNFCNPYVMEYYRIHPEIGLGESNGRQPNYNPGDDIPNPTDLLFRYGLDTTYYHYLGGIANITYAPSLSGYYESDGSTSSIYGNRIYNSSNKRTNTSILVW